MTPDLHHMATAWHTFPLSLGSGVTGDAIGLSAVSGLLFLAGLAGSLTHCVGMCGPFVLAQTAALLPKTGPYGELQRLRGAALIPYHMGRLTTYAGLGALMGVGGGALTTLPWMGWFVAALLLTAAGALALAALGHGMGRATPSALGLAGWVTSLARGHQGYRLGLVLGLLPCGLLWSALVAAAGTGGALAGALAMLGFGFGTAPALLIVGWLGVFATRRRPRILRWLAAPLLLANALFLVATAWTVAQPIF